MELYEFKNNDGSLTCSFYIKSKLSNEVHGFKMVGKHVDICLDAISKLSVKSFKQIGNKDLEVSYKHGKLIIRDYEKILGLSKFKELEHKINDAFAKTGEKSNKLLKHHKEKPKNIVKKANRVKSVSNYNKKTLLFKRECYEFKNINNELVCTYAGTSKMTRKKFSYTYSGKQASKTLLNVSKSNIKEFQNLDDNIMEVTYKKGKVRIADFNNLFKSKEFRNIKSNIVKKSNKLKHKEVKSRYLAMNKQSKWVNRTRSLKNFGKKAIVGSTFCSFVLFGSGFGTPLFDSSYGYPTNDTNSIHMIEEDNIANEVMTPDVNINQIEEKTNEEVKAEQKDEVKEEAPQVNKSNTNNNVYSSDYFEFNYGYRAASADNIRKLYQPIIDKYSKMYGLDSNLMLGIAAHERGTHSSVKDPGGAIGLMQIQVGVWNGSTISVYNYQTGQKESIYITEDRLADVDFNIRVGCAIYQNNLKAFNYDPIAALQAYNYGSGGVGRLMRNYGNNWLNNRSVVNGGNYSKGDHLYVEHVLSYIYSSDYNLQFQTPNGIKQLTIHNKALETAKTR